MGKKKSILDLGNMKQEGGVKLICLTSDDCWTAGFAERNMDPYPGHYRGRSSFSRNILQTPEIGLRKAPVPLQIVLKAQADLGCNVLHTNLHSRWYRHPVRAEASKHEQANSELYLQLQDRLILNAKPYQTKIADSAQVDLSPFCQFLFSFSGTKPNLPSRTAIRGQFVDFPFWRHFICDYLRPQQK